MCYATLSFAVEKLGLSLQFNVHPGGFWQTSFESFVEFVKGPLEQAQVTKADLLNWLNSVLDPETYRTYVSEAVQSPRKVKMRGGKLKSDNVISSKEYALDTGYDTASDSEKEEFLEQQFTYPQYPINLAQYRKLASLHLQPIRIKPDGDCIYNAFRLTAKVAKTMMQLRAEVAEWILDHADEVVANYGVSLRIHNKNDVNELCKKIKEQGQFDGSHGDVALQVLGAIYNKSVDIVQHDDHGTVAHVHNGSGPAVTVIFVQGPHPHYYGTEQQKTVHLQNV